MLLARFAFAFCVLLALAPRAAHAQSSTLAGVLFDAEMWSPILQQYEAYRIYVPPDYFVTGNERRYPTLYMLHGAGGNYTEWTDSYLPQQLDDMIVRGDIQPMIVVMPDGGSRTFWANWDEGPAWSDYVAYDVVAEIDSRYRTVRPRRAARLAACRWVAWARCRSRCVTRTSWRGRRAQPVDSARA